MAKCLRCGAGNEWIEGSPRKAPIDDSDTVEVPVEPTEDLLEIMFLLERL